MRCLDLEEIVDDTFEKMEKAIHQQHQVIGDHQRLIKQLEQKLDAKQ